VLESDEPPFDLAKNKNENFCITMSSVRRLLRVLFHQGTFASLTILLSLVFLVLSRVAMVYVPLFYRRIVDLLSSGGATLEAALWIIGGYGVVRVASVLLGEMRDFLFAPIEQRVLQQINLSVFEHLHRLSLRFHLARKTGEVSRVMDRGSRSIESFFRYSLFSLGPTFLELFLVFGVVLYLYPPLFGGVIFVTLGSYILFTFCVSSWRLKFMRSMNKESNLSGARAVDSLLNYTTVKYFNSETHETTHYKTFLANYRHAAVRNRWSLTVLNTGQGIILSVGLVWVMLCAVPRVLNGSFSLGDFVLLNTYLLQVYHPLHILGFAYREIRQALIDMEDFFKLLDIPQEIQDKPNAPLLIGNGGHVVFDNVRFGYTKDRLILKGVSFEVPPRKTVAIVGPSGAGKSTIVSLLLRFFEPSSGRILIDGQNITDVTQDSVRRMMGVVPQDTVLFNQTLLENIKYGDPAADRQAIEVVLKQSQMDIFVQKLPKGLDTMVGERGLKLSGGEKQRVGIARMLLKKPQIFIFDEATSALDSSTEQQIQRSIQKLATGHTTLIIAHRLSTIAHADRIYVMEDGQMREMGTHRELLSQKGLYATLWQKQHAERHDSSDF
jgi:ATP-binding cassette subfamily B protein